MSADSRMHKDSEHTIKEPDTSSGDGTDSEVGSEGSWVATDSSVSTQRLALEDAPDNFDPVDAPLFYRLGLYLGVRLKEAVNLTDLEEARSSLRRAAELMLDSEPDKWELRSAARLSDRAPSPSPNTASRVRK